MAIICTGKIFDESHSSRICTAIAFFKRRVQWRTKTSHYIFAFRFLLSSRLGGIIIMVLHLVWRLRLALAAATRGFSLVEVIGVD